MLPTYFGDLPAAQARLADAYAASLAQLPDGRAKRQGLRFGERAADHIIALRADDGRFAPVTFDMPPAPGVWRPTPPATAPFFAPWLGQVTPLMLDSPSQFRPAAPPALTSATYAAEFDEVKALGAKASALRTPAQTETVLFISSIAQEPMQAALRDLATRYGMDISDRARLFAAVDMSVADAIIACWDSKVHYGLWRPITAIRLADEDGNPATAADAAWEPLLATPPYPDYVSGLYAVIGARHPRADAGARHGPHRPAPSARRRRTPPATTSSRTRCAPTRSTRASGRASTSAPRTWSGGTLGKQVADWALDRYFMPR